MWTARLDYSAQQNAWHAEQAKQLVKCTSGQAITRHACQSSQSSEQLTLKPCFCRPLRHMV